MKPQALNKQKRALWILVIVLISLPGLMVTQGQNQDRNQRDGDRARERPDTRHGASREWDWDIFLRGIVRDLFDDEAFWDDRYDRRPPRHRRPPRWDRGKGHDRHPDRDRQPDRDNNGFVRSDRASWHVWHNVQPGTSPRKLHIRGQVTVSATNYQARLRRVISSPETLHYEVVVEKTGDYGGQALTTRDINYSRRYNGSHDEVSIHLPNGRRYVFPIRKTH